MDCLPFFRNVFCCKKKYVAPPEPVVNIKIDVSSIPGTKNIVSIQDTNDLKNVTYKTTVKFVPPITCGKVVKIYDGDTITIAAKLPYDDSPMYRFPVRLFGIDSAEIKGKSENEKRLAKIARDALSELILDKIVTLLIVDTEKYGRILAVVYLGDLNINTWLLANKYAIPYDGGTKTHPEEWSD
jgi:micrococcal nuclease